MQSDCTEFADATLPPALTNNIYKNARMYYVDDITPDDCGCFQREKINLNKIPYGWVAKRNVPPLVFHFENCRRVFILFERTNLGDGGKAMVTANTSQKTLDADFKDGWGIYSNHEIVFDSEAPKNVMLEIKPMLENGKHFSIAGIMVS